MNADWVHCNKCYRLMANSPNVSFYITMCQHIFCRSCLSSVCQMCGAHAKAMKIDSNMHESIKCFFDNFETMKAKMFQILDFQNKQMANFDNKAVVFIPNHIRKQKMARKLEKGYWLLKESVRKERAEYEKMKNQIILMKRFVQKHEALQVRSNSSQYSSSSGSKYHPYRRMRSNARNSESNVTFSSGYSSASRTMLESTMSGQSDSFSRNETYSSCTGRERLGNSIRSQSQDSDDSIWERNRFC